MFERVKAMLGSNKQVAQRLGRFDTWLTALPIADARSMAERALARPGRFTVSRNQHGVRGDLPSEAAALFACYSSIYAGGAALDLAVIKSSPEFPGCLVVGRDIEQAPVVLRPDDRALVADIDVLGGAVAPFLYPSLWHYLLEVDAFTWPNDSEAARAAAA